MGCNYISLKELVSSANTGADAIKRAPIVEENTGLKCIRIGDISNNRPIEEWGFTRAEDTVIKKFLLRKDDILVARTGNTIGVVKYIDKDLDALYNNGLIRLKINPNFYPKYVYYNMISRNFKEYIYGISAGTSTQPNMKINHMLDYKVMDICYNEQKVIADILSTLDDKIELNNQMNETLEEMAQALFKRWFVDFEFPNEEGQPYKSSGGEMVESELGLLPKGWNSGTLSNICEYRKDKVSTAQINLENYISTENMISNKAGITVATGLPSVDKVNKFEPKNILVSNIRPYFKKIYFADIEGGCSNDVLCFKTHKEEYAIFLFLTLFEDKFFDYMMAGAKGTKMPRGDKNQIMKYIITIAPSNVYIDFNNLILPILTKISEHKKQNKILIELRDSLLPKLMSGEIRVRDLEN